MDIVVTIPKNKIKEIEAEEAAVAAQIAKGVKGWQYYWTMARLPKIQPKRIYFVWDGAIRAYHEVTDMRVGRIYMKTEIHEIEPIPQAGFQGFRYFKG